MVNVAKAAIAGEVQGAANEVGNVVFGIKWGGFIAGHRAFC
jgi:hypothetical protein